MPSVRLAVVLAASLPVSMALAGCAGRPIPIVDQPGPYQRGDSLADAPAGTARVQVDCSHAADWVACAPRRDSAGLVPGRYDRSGQFIPSGQKR